MPDTPRVAVLGAGAVGCFVGGLWKAAGLDVRFVGRQRIAAEIAEYGLTLSDHAGWSWACTPQDLVFYTEPDRLSEAEVILLTVKCTAVGEATQRIARHASPGASVLSLLNGVRPVPELQAALPDHTVIAGMVPFNVAALGRGRWHQGTKGHVTIEQTELTERLARVLSDTRAALTLEPDMTSVLWGKLLLNLNNPINALSGATLHEELSQRGYRRVLAATIREALAVLEAAGITPAKVAALPPKALPAMLETPDWFFRNTGLRLQKIDRQARSSMADDFAHGRETEVDFLNGEVVALAERHGVEAPLNARVVALVKTAETNGLEPLSADALIREVIR